MSTRVEIFSGTGGVGKTTLATSRAYHLAKEGTKVLLITIDPAKRLKDVLNLNENDVGKLIKVENCFEKNEKISLHAMLMSPTETIKKIGAASKIDAFEKNRIVSILARPSGGLNEILSIVELNFQIESNAFEVIVLDTPPGGHFLDFLDSANKIESFFNPKFIEVFEFIKNKSEVKFGFKIISTGINKLIEYLEKVTGESFVTDFIEAISVIYKAKDSFLNSLNLKNKLKTEATWFLVTSVDQNKAKEAISLINNAQDFFNENTHILINKSLIDELRDWDAHSEEEVKFRNSLIIKEEKLLETFESKFKNIFLFKEILSNSPQEQVKQLAIQWKKYLGDKNGQI